LIKILYNVLRTYYELVGRVWIKKPIRFLKKLRLNGNKAIIENLLNCIKNVHQIEKFRKYK